MAKPTTIRHDFGLDGMAAHQKGDLVKAEQLYLKALEFNAHTLTALNGLGVLRAAQQKFAEAADLFERAMTVDPAVKEFRTNWAKAQYELARACEKAQQKDEAIVHYGKVLAELPDHLESLTHLGELMRDKRDLKESERLLKRALKLQPNHYGVLNNLGMLRQTQNRLPEAAEILKRVTQLKPDFLLGFNNLAVVLQDMGDCDGALAAYDAAAKLDADYTLSLYNKALCLLTYGRLAEGWDLWIARCKLKNRRSFPQPLWDGTNLQGKSIVLWGDQGIGEDILTFSTVDDLLAQGAHVVAEEPERLSKLLRRTYPQVEFVKKPPMPDPEHIRDDLTEPRAYDRTIDYQGPTFWPAVHLRRNFDVFPAGRRSFLKADPERTAQLRTKYQALGKKYIIGIAWRSGAKLGRYKSSALLDWLPLLQRPDTAFIDLQYGNTAAERADFARRHPDILIYHDDTIDQVPDLDGFAAQIEACDAIVSVSNTTVHMAGAIGKQCHVLLPAGLGSLWYWFRGRSDNPWYPSLTLHRQAAVGAWQDTVQSASKALKI